MKNTFGLTLTIVFFIISFTSLHILIPGVKYLKLGLLTTIFLIPIVIMGLRSVEWLNPLGKWRLFFLLSVIPGLFIGYGTGKVRGVFITNIQEFIGSFLAVCIFVQNIDALRKINYVIITASGAVALYVLLHSGQGPGMIVDENDAGLVLVMLLPFAYFNFVLSTNKLKKIILLLIFLIVLLAIAATISRGAMVGTLPTLFIIWLKSKKKIFTIIGIIAILTLVVLWGPPALLNEFKSIGATNEGTAGSRRYFWDLSIELFKKKPIFGVGARCWGNAVWSGIINLPHHVSNSTPHSVYFQLISELGLLGIISWGGLTVKTFFIGNEIKNLTTKQIEISYDNHDERVDLQFLMMFANSLVVGLVGGLICGLFLSFLFYPHIYVYIGFMQVAYIVTRQKCGLL